MACFNPQNIAMQKKKNRKFWTWRYSFLIDRIYLLYYTSFIEIQLETHFGCEFLSRIAKTQSVQVVSYSKN